MTEKCGLLTLKLQVYHFPRESASILSLDSLIRHVGRHKLGAWVFIPSQAARYSLVPLFQSESKCETILMKMTLIFMKMKMHAELIFI